MKIAIYGGSFNPFHIAHATVAQTMVLEYGYDRVIFVPSSTPPHKEITEGAPAWERYKMLKAFCKASNTKAFVVEDCEIKRGGISYTIDTVKYLLEKYKSVIEGKPALIMGSEMATEFHKWKNADEIASLTDLFIVPRFPDYDKSDINHKNRPSGQYKGDFNSDFNEEDFKYNYTLFKEAVLPLSSTKIRKRIADHKSYEYLLPTSIYNYIRKHKLYED
jgi:nicotinate-nucleotide adenylyltransferase